MTFFEVSGLERDLVMLLCRRRTVQILPPPSTHLTQLSSEAHLLHVGIFLSVFLLLVYCPEMEVLASTVTRYLLSSAVLRRVAVFGSGVLAHRLEI